LCWRNAFSSKGRNRIPFVSIMAACPFFKKQQSTNRRALPRSMRRNCRLPDGQVRLVAPEWVGRLAGFTLLFEHWCGCWASRCPFASMARMVDLCWHRMHANCTRYVQPALADADLSEVTAVAIAETSSRRRYNMRHWLPTRRRDVR
jgi:hypothetical protein